MRYIGAVLLLLAIGAPSAHGTDLQGAYVGKSSCAVGLNGGNGRYGIRLDKKQIARIETRTSGNKKFLMIVQYKKEWDDCGTVRDIIETRDRSRSFVLECVDDRDPASVVVGTWKTPKISGRSLESWRIDLKTLRFVPVGDRLRFVPHGQGADDGSDLVDLARQRAKRSKTAPAR